MNPTTTSGLRRCWQTLCALLLAAAGAGDLVARSSYSVDDAVEGVRRALSPAGPAR